MAVDGTYGHFYNRSRHGIEGGLIAVEAQQQEHEQGQEQLEHLARSIDAWVTGATTARHDLARKLALACRRLDRLVQHAAADNSHAQWADALRDMGAQLAGRDRRIADLETSIISLQRELGRLREAVKSAKEGRASYMADVEAMRQHHAALQEALASKSQEAAQAEQRLAKSERLREQIDEHEGRMARLQQQLEEAQALTKATVREKDAELAEVNASLFEAEHALGELSARLDEETATFQAALAAKEEEVAGLKSALGAAAAEHEGQEETARALVEARQQLNEARAHLAVRDAELAELSAALEEARDAAPVAGETAEEVAALKKLVDARGHEVHQLAVERDEAQSRLMEFEARLRDAEALAPQLAQALRDRDEAHGLIVALRAQLDSGPEPSHAGSAGGDEIPAFDQDGHKRRIGEILLAMGVIDQEQLQHIVSEQGRDRQQRFGLLAVEMGYTNEELIARVLAAQLRLPFTRLTGVQIDAAILGLLSPEAARKNRCLPIAREHQHLRLAMANPLDLIAIENVEIASKMRVEPLVAAPGDLDAAIVRLYGA
jgi:chromosome segregation ATPase